MMHDCQTYSRKLIPSKTMINCSNHGIMLKTKRIDTLSSWKYTMSNYAYKFRYSIVTKSIKSPCYIWKLAFSPHKFTHPPSSWKWIRTFGRYGVMLPFSGISLQQNILKISVLFPDLWWMEKRPTLLHVIRVLKNFPSFVEVGLIYSRKLI
jgi:hypothetical protein